jgi:hypothetical protein
MTRLDTSRIGSISTGTLRPQDLIPVFLGVLEECDKEAADQIQDKIPTEALEDEDHEWWEGEDPAWALEECEEALNDHAPPGCYFGANEGDGADFGFWKESEPETSDEDEEPIEIRYQYGDEEGDITFHRYCTTNSEAKDMIGRIVSTGGCHWEQDGPFIYCALSGVNTESVIEELEEDGFDLVEE